MLFKSFVALLAVTIFAAGISTAAAANDPLDGLLAGLTAGAGTTNSSSGSTSGASAGASTGAAASKSLPCNNVRAFVSNSSAGAVSYNSVVAKTYNARSGPGTNCNLVGSFKAGESVGIVRRSGNWQLVRSSRGAAWVHVGAFASPAAASGAAASVGSAAVQTSPCLSVKSFVKNSSSGEPTHNGRIAKTYNARSGPSTSCHIVGSFGAGETVGVVRSNGDWRLVNSSKGSAWVHVGAFGSPASSVAAGANTGAVASKTSKCQTETKFSQVYQEAASRITPNFELYRNANARSGPASGCNKVGTFRGGEKVVRIVAIDQYSLVNGEQGAAWVLSSQLSRLVTSKEVMDRMSPDSWQWSGEVAVPQVSMAGQRPTVDGSKKKVAIRVSSNDNSVCAWMTDPLQNFDLKLLVNPANSPWLKAEHSYSYFDGERSGACIEHSLWLEEVRVSGCMELCSGEVVVYHKEDATKVGQERNGISEAIVGAVDDEKDTLLGAPCSQVPDQARCKPPT